MRISDWSSDVCSSDLIHLWRGSALTVAHIISAMAPRRKKRLTLPWLTGATQGKQHECYSTSRDEGQNNQGHSRQKIQFFRILYRSEEHTSELQSIMRISYAVFCLNNTTKKTILHTYNNNTK